MAKLRQRTFDRETSGRETNVVSLRHASAGGKRAEPRLSDPAVAPVGTDAEAAGMASAAEQAASAAHAEMARQARGGDSSARHQRSMARAVILVAVVLTALVTVAAVLWTRA